MIEIELKLQLTEAAAAQIAAAPLLSASPRTVAQRSVYFDSPDRRLLAAGLSLRVREAGGGFVQTVKRAEGGSAGLHSRPEWERRIDGDRPLLDDADPSAAVLADKAAALTPIFAVAVTRRIWRLEEAGAVIELALDQGEVVAADRQSRFHECELELLSGPPAALFAIARRLGAAAPVRLGVQTKSGRGDRLVGPLPVAFKAEDVPLTDSMTAAEAFQRIALSCVRQFRLNEDLLLDTRAAEPVHQARVALRRLRSAFRVFRPVLAGNGAALAEDLRWLAASLGETRDLDVLMARARPGPFQARLWQARQAACETAIEALESERARGLMLDLAEWLGHGTWLDDPHTRSIRETPAVDFARDALARWRRRVGKDGRDLIHLTDEHRHSLRKDAKKLRYATEFFAALFADRRPKRHRRFAAALSDLQDQLGLLNDLSAGPAVLDRLGLADQARDQLLTPSGSRDALLSAAAEAHRRLVRAKGFWT